MFLEYDVTSDCNIIQYFIDPPIGNNPVPYFFRVKAKIPILPNARQYIWILKEIPSNQEVYSYTSTVGFADSTPEVEVFCTSFANTSYTTVYF